MNWLHHRADELQAECTRELPRLHQVEMICGIDLQTFNAIPTLSLPLFQEVDESSTEMSKATFLAYYWLMNQVHTGPLQYDCLHRNEKTDFDIDQEKFEMVCATEILRQRLLVQLRRDPHFMKNLKKGYADFRARFREGMANLP